MSENKPRILIISSADPTKGPGTLSRDWYFAYKQQGYDVNVLTLKKCESHPDFLYVYDPNTRLYEIKTYIKDKIHKIYMRIWAAVHKCNRHYSSENIFFYLKEENPPVRVSRVLSKIHKNYDIVHILFWQEMLSFKTVNALYRKLNCFFIFDCMDYSPMSGGCHFTGNCTRYKIGCGCCPAFDSKDPKDFTWQNVNYRRIVYDEIRPFVTGNSYMFGFFEQSLLLKNINRIKSYPIIDQNLFKPLNQSFLYTKFGVSEDKKFKVLFGCQNISDERKGTKYLIEAINIFIKGLSTDERSSILVMTIGQDFELVKPLLKGIDTYDFGYTSVERLASIYAFADVFLCSSVNDAGPMMVNQALCCGTPVVGFEMGVCLDAVKDQGTGYCAKLFDVEDFAKGITKIFRQTCSERAEMRFRCTDLSQRMFSYEASVKRMIDGYHLYGTNKNRI